MAAEAAAEAERAAKAAAAQQESDATKFANYAYRAEDHAERKAIMATLKPTPRELAIAEALRRAPKDFIDAIPRDEFGDIHPTPEQQEEIDRIAREITANEPAGSADRKQINAVAELALAT